MREPAPPDSARSESEHVLLLPGLGPGGVEMLLLRRRLARAGFAPRIVHALWWRRPFETCIARAAAVLDACAGTRVHLVGHSYGGLVAAGLACVRPGRVGRIVTLGTPHCGCEAAERVYRLLGGRGVLGCALASALERVPLALPPGTELGTIAGRARIGLARLLAIRAPNDSVVRVDEAHHPQASDSLTVPCAHAWLLVSAAVAAQTIGFLHEGRFARGTGLLARQESG